MVPELLLGTAVAAASLEISCSQLLVEADVVPIPCAVLDTCMLTADASTLGVVMLAIFSHTLFPHT
jgi:hypothetical protein